MKKKLFVNDKKYIQYPDGKAVQPGDSRMIDICHFKDEPKQFNAFEFVGQAVKKITKTVIAGLSDEQLSEVIVAEDSLEKPRGSVQKLLASELEDRQLKMATENVLAQLNELSVEELQEKLIDPDNTDEDVALVQQVLDAKLGDETPSGDAE